MSVETIRQGLRYWVLGLIVEYNGFSKIFDAATPFEPTKEGWLFTEYWGRIERTCAGYMAGTQTLDGSCPDMECIIAQKADYLFGAQFRAALQEQREARLKAQKDWANGHARRAAEQRDLSHEADMRKLRKQQLQDDCGEEA